MSLTSAETSIGTVKQNTTIQLTQLCSNCTYINLTQVIYPNQSYSLLGQYPMTKNGSNFNYSFTDTNTLGNYYYTTCGDLNGINTCQTINFKVTSSGQEFTISSSISTFIPLILMFLLTLSLLFLAGMVNKKEYKWVLVILSAGFFVLTISYGITASQETLSQFSSLNNWVVALIKIVSLTVTGGIIIAAVIAIIVVIKKLFQIRMGEQK